MYLHCVFSFMWLFVDFHFPFSIFEWCESSCNCQSLSHRVMHSNSRQTAYMLSSLLDLLVSTPSSVPSAWQPFLKTTGMSLTLYYTRIYDGASRLQHTARNLKRGRVTENNCKAIRNAGYMLISNMFSIF